MRRWLPRTLWLLTWSVWVWLGFGLYRELPREGPVICRLPIDGLESFVGVMEGSEAAVTFAKREGTKTVVRIRDFSSGEVAKEMPGPLSPREDSIPNWLSPRTDFLLTVKSPDRPVGWLSSKTTYSALNLSTGLWRDLNVPANQPPEFHQSRPLAMFRSRNRDADQTVVAIVDLRTGARLFSWPTVGEARVKIDLRFAAFVGDDKFLLAFREQSTTSRDKVRTRVEIWSLEDLSAPAATHSGVEVDVFDSMSNSGLVAWIPNLNHSEEFKVHDLVTNRLLFDNCKPHDDAWQFHGGIFNSREPFVFSADGKSCLNPFRGMIVDLERGVPRWRLNPLEPDHLLVEMNPQAMFSDGETLGVKCLERIEGVDARGWFQVKENWVACYRPWLRTATTYAVRDASSGALAYRLWRPLPIDFTNHIRYIEQRITLDRRWLVASDGGVYRLPPPANYPLLALCQTILALPLVLLWAALRWRRKGRMRWEHSA